MTNITKKVASNFTLRYNQALLAREKASLEASNHISHRVDEYLYLKSSRDKLEAELINLEAKLTEYDVMVRDMKNNILYQPKAKFSVLRCRSLVEKTNEKGDTITTQCSGNIDENKGYCLSCNIDCCMTCSAPVYEDTIHVCKESDIADFLTYIAKYRPCPKCSCAIEKTEGCTTMFCMNCHVAWDWNTREIIEGSFHNPEHQLLIANGTIAPQIANSDGDGFREYKSKIVNKPGFPSQSWKLFYMYDALAEILNNYKSDYAMLEGTLNFAKQLYKRGIYDESKFQRVIIDYEAKKSSLPIVLNNLREIKKILQNHIETTISAESLDMDEIKDGIISGAINTAKQIIAAISQITNADANFMRNNYQFVSIVNEIVNRSAPQRVDDIISLFNDFVLNFRNVEE